jgi:hypothetical protein
MKHQLQLHPTTIEKDASIHNVVWCNLKKINILLTFFRITSNSILIMEKIKIILFIGINY